MVLRPKYDKSLKHTMNHLANLFALLIAMNNTRPRRKYESAINFHQMISFTLSIIQWNHDAFESSACARDSFHQIDQLI